MAEVLQLFSITRHLYQPDVLPLAKLQLESSVRRLRERYKFTGTAVAPGVQLVASAGQFFPEAATMAVPVQVVFASNAIEVQVAGETEVAEQFQQDLLRFLAEVAGDQRPNFPEYARSVQTIAIVRLLIPPEALLSEKLNTYLTSTAVPAFATSDAETHVQLAHLQWSVSYTRNATDYSYEPKLFTIEPRVGTRPSDRTYYTQSPTDSKTHSRLLEQLEETLR